MMQVFSSVRPQPVRFGLGNQAVKPDFDLRGFDPTSALMAKIPGSTRPGLSVLKTQAQWDALWTASTLSGQKKPAVDFSRQAVLVYFLSDNFDVKDLSFNDDKNQMSVKIQRLRFNMIPSFDAPYYLAVVDKRYLDRPPTVA